jgi:hypothetical protein
VLPLDYIHALCLVGIAIYIWRREPPRLLLTPLMLISFFVLYGVGNIIYFVGVVGADTVPYARRAVTLSLILMWFGIVFGIELARACMPVRAARAAQVVRDWKATKVDDRSHGDQLLAALGIIVAVFILGMFLYLGKLSQLHSFFSFDLTADKTRYRADFSGGGGYVYQILVASVAAFVSFLLLVRGIAARKHHLVAIGLLVCVAVLAGKLGTFQKIPWLVYLLQLMVVFQATRSLDIGIGRIVVLSIVVVAGALVAALVAIPNLDSTSIFEWLGYRFFQVNNEVIYQTFYVYPQYLPHTWGMNIGLIHGVFGNGELLSAYSRVASFFGAEGATFDAFFISDAWVDFSYGGVLVMAVIVGFVVKGVDIFVLSLGKTPLCLALLGSGMYGLFELQVTSAFTAFLTGGLLFIPLLASVSAGLVNDLRRGHEDQGSQASPLPR